MVDYKEYFPYPEIRESQTRAIEFALDAFLEQDKRFVIIEAGTGVGKSAIGFTIAKTLNEALPHDENYVEGTYFITTQKILQDQYIRDFSTKGMKTLKGSQNYACVGDHDTCASGQRALKIEGNSSRNFKKCMFKCTYKLARREFIESRTGVTNFAYFLASTMYTDVLAPRELLVVDEAHNSDLELAKFIEVSLTEKFARDTLKLKMPHFSTQHQAFKWIIDVYEPALKKYANSVEKIMAQFQGLKDKLKESIQYARQFEALDKHICKVHRFINIYDKDNWVVNFVEADGRSSRRIEFKPIDVSPFSEEMLFAQGKKVLMMTATILDKDGFCELMGINQDDCSFISIPSPFPVENRPVIAMGMGSMAYRAIDETLPNLLQGVKEIMKAHKGEKGIIHAHSYKIAKYLKQNLKSSRILIHNSENRDEILDKHMKSKKATVLLSPSMQEGVDLKNDASRFQIICKVPWPYLGDKLVKKRMNRWKWWYPLQTAKLVIQSVGRSVRNKDDHAVTYILDSDWERFYSRNKELFPEDFKNALQN